MPNQGLTDDQIILLIYVGVAAAQILLWGFASLAVAYNRGHGLIRWFFAGALLGPLSLLIILLQPTTYEQRRHRERISGRGQCVDCAEFIHVDALVCPYCGHRGGGRVRNDPTVAFYPQ